MNLLKKMLCNAINNLFSIYVLGFCLTFSMLTILLIEMIVILQNENILPKNFMSKTSGPFFVVVALISFFCHHIYYTWSQSKQPHVNLLTNENPLSLAEARISSFNRDIRELKQDREKEIDKLNDLRHQNNNQNGEEFNLLIQKTEKRIEQIDITLEYYSEQMTECLKTRMQPNKI